MRTFNPFARRPAANQRDRRGAAAVEFALVAPLLFVGLALPMIEFGRAMMVSELVTNAARAGCRAGAIPSASNSSITSAVNDLLTNSMVNGASTSVKVNGSTTDASTAVQGDSLTVTVTVPYSSVTWLPSGFSGFLSGQSLSSTQVMRRE